LRAHAMDKAQIIRELQELLNELYEPAFKNLKQSREKRAEK